VARTGVRIDPTASVHPTAVLEGSVTIGAYSRVGAHSVLTGTVTVGHHVNIQCGVVFRGRVTIGNYTHVYDLVNIEGGRPRGPMGSSLASEDEQAIVGDYCWVNHGATMHGTRLHDEAAVGGNAFCDYGTRIGGGAILGNGSATNVGQVIPENCLAEGVPARVTRENLTDQDRQGYFGLLPKAWAAFEGELLEKAGIERAR
jgi:carbonic anhydrase/acetyltransferase-like protein (isoleucine patch superfamily)